MIKKVEKGDIVLLRTKEELLALGMREESWLRKTALSGDGVYILPEMMKYLGTKQEILEGGDYVFKISSGFGFSMNVIKEIILSTNNPLDVIKEQIKQEIGLK